MVIEERIMKIHPVDLLCEIIISEIDVQIAFRTHICIHSTLWMSTSQYLLAAFHLRFV